MQSERQVRSCDCMMRTAKQATVCKGVGARERVNNGVNSYTITLQRFQLDHMVRDPSHDARSAPIAFGAERDFPQDHVRTGSEISYCSLISCCSRPGHASHRKTRSRADQSKDIVSLLAQNVRAWNGISLQEDLYDRYPFSGKGMLQLGIHDPVVGRDTRRWGWQCRTECDPPGKIHASLPQSRQRHANSLPWGKSEEQKNHDWSWRRGVNGPKTRQHLGK